jgi:hypothetical protein
MGFGQFHHLGNTLGEQPIIGMQHFAVFALGGDLTHGVIPVRHLAQKLVVVVDANSGVLLGVTLSDLQ